MLRVTDALAPPDGLDTRQDLAASAPSVAAISVRVTGRVRGVGFRLFIYRIAQGHKLRGWVRNAGDAVELLLEGDDTALDACMHDLEHSAPPVAVIDQVAVSHAVRGGLTDFRIVDDVAGDEAESASPRHDVATVHVHAG